MQSLKVFLVLVFFSFNIHFVVSQPYKIEGRVVDEHGHALIGATVKIVNSSIGAATDKDGIFRFEIKPGMILLEYKFLGYTTCYDTLQVNTNTYLEKKLKTLSKELNELSVIEYFQPKKIVSALKVDLVDKAFLQTENAGSLMQSLSRLPGVSSIDIGSGQSKPVIRGLGFNRVVVAENGVKHLAQEWGVDHGLEIDQFSIDRIELVKGPGSLLYGSDAIGGVIDLRQTQTITKSQVQGRILTNYQTNNDLFGISVGLFQGFDKFSYKLYYSHTNYSDYKVPVDSINYMTYNIRLNDRRLRNTAGLKRNAGLTIGFVDDHFSTRLTFTENFEKSGFFANAHGLEIRNSQIDYDLHSSDIDLPYQQVNHLKFLSNSNWSFLDYNFYLDLGWQNNYRQEFSEAVAHGYMPQPVDSLERLYHKNSWTGSLRIDLPKHHINQMTAGINWEYQDNKSGGWGFMLPDFETLNFGAYLYDNVYFSETFQLTMGARYDLGEIATNAYNDWYSTPILGEDVYVQRAEALDKWYGSFSWAIGFKQKLDDLVLKLNLGKSFRMPTAKELASNGINYHMYRFEKGDVNLKAEQSYQLDFSTEYSKNKWSVELNPFLNYFPNYIYLNPTSKYMEAQQVYFYSQASVFRAGGELWFNLLILDNLNFTADLEYVYAQQLSGDKKGFTLPFSPPLSSNFELKYKQKQLLNFENTTFSVLLKFVADQNEIVPPELKTPGYALVNLGASNEFYLYKQLLRFNLKLNNIFNTKYYDHTSFYRLIQVPGPGRNFLISLEIPIN